MTRSMSRGAASGGTTEFSTEWRDLAWLGHIRRGSALLGIVRLCAEFQVPGLSEVLDYTEISNFPVCLYEARWPSAS